MSDFVVQDGGGPTVLTGYKSSGGHKVAASTVAAKNATAFTSRVVSVRPDADCYFELGGTSVSATTTTSHFCGSGERLDIALDSDETHISVKTSSGNVTMYVSEREVP